MIFKFCVSAAISCLITILVYTIKANLSMQKQITNNEKEIHNIRQEMEILNAKYIETVKDAAWLRGMRTGRNFDNSKEDNRK